MRCLICKHLTASPCPPCSGGSGFQPKSNEDIIAEGVEIYEHKMDLPQYAAYKDNPQAAERLLKDCIREAAFFSKINTKSLELLKGGTNG